MRITVARYVLVDDVLFRRLFSQPLLKYFTLDQANYVLREIHKVYVEIMWIQDTRSSGFDPGILLAQYKERFLRNGTKM